MSSLKLSLRRIFSTFYKSSFVGAPNCNSFCSYVQSPINTYNGNDPAPIFFDENVQKILKKLTGLNLDKIFNRRHLEHKNKKAEYKFFTDEDLKEHMDRTLIDAERLLQMPPVIKERVPITEIISEDPELQSWELESKVIFTDITFGGSDRTRLIVVRDTNGDLRYATWEERHRANQIYNPRDGRDLKPPAAFTDENYFKNLLSRDEFCFILDLACGHYEPDDPEYQTVIAKTYEYINKRSKQDFLFSTRHYGPYCFYLAWNNKIDNLLIQYINEEKLNDAVTLIELFHNIHPDSKSASEVLDEDAPLKFIKVYAESDSNLRPNLLMCIQSFEELQLEKERQEEMIRSSQGVK